MLKSKRNPVYFIAEIGQNHQGSVNTAIELIEMAAKAKVDAVKFCKRDMEDEMSSEMYISKYDNGSSFGSTYGEHREALELSYNDYVTLEKVASDNGLDFIVTMATHLAAVRLGNYVSPDYIKIASRDIYNRPLLKASDNYDVPIIISTGAARSIEDIDKAVNLLENCVSILHCISTYPARNDMLRLGAIKSLQQAFVDKIIGFSDHSIGILAPVVAMLKGAKVIEKHITFDRNAKGSDHASALGPDGLRRVMRDIRNVGKMDNSGGVILMPDESKIVMSRIGKSVASARDISAGDVLSENDLHYLSPGTGDRDMVKYIGAMASCDISKNTILSESMLSGEIDGI